ncbi:hypothetical protein EU527_16990 [Candidatus Thorarchaeota archaeon]|nr:MAG: hypothetical protein EU527_16990 [Candidatus Thorarchaeota archaeon]
MVRVYRVNDTESIDRGGYSARYFADILFSKKLDSAGFIFVSIPSGMKTEPHVHAILEEIFIALTPVTVIVNNTSIDLQIGDIAIVQPGEHHSMQSRTMEECRLVAIKFPNLEDDKNAFEFH